MLQPSLSFLHILNSGQMTMFLGGIVRRSAGGRRLLSCPHSRDLSSMNVLSVNKGSLMTLSRRRVPSPTCGLATLGRGAAAAFDNAKPLESVRTDDVSLESAYIPLAIPSGRPLTEFPYFLSATTLKTAKLLTAFNLSPLGNKNLVLVSPHPGSRRLLYHVVNDVALGLKAGVLSLDYQWFVKEFKALQRSGLKYPQTYGNLSIASCV